MLVSATTECLQQARKYKDELANKIFGIRAFRSGIQTQKQTIPLGKTQIVGFGYGAKVVNGKILDRICVRVYVREKLLNSDLSRWEKIPSEVNGLPTDVIKVGEILPMQHRTLCGVSVGHYQVTGGTLGCLVQCDRNQRYILSNNHVLAHINQANNGDAILEPSLLEGGDINHPIARLTDFEPIQWQGQSNTMDAAIAKLIEEQDVDTKICEVGYVQETPMLAEIERRVCKYGSTTGLTQGIVEGLSEDVFDIWYDNNRRASFQEQIAIRGVCSSFSEPGDSGSLIVDEETKQPIALLFAGSSDITFANPISPILQRFNVRILGQASEEN
ncbi:MAG: hypothetical protein SAK29_33290 [Scytonema sp. PMC 1069.18]|nr:hypothetical protein [Scytonema sp. PMC 1069.18]MEC4886856.1 hypothetical protein [Scytonema sp. PMC 1070.18]